MNVIGIDPGLDGAICFLADDGKASLFDTPVLQVGKKREHDIAGMVNLLIAVRSHHPVAAMEAVHSMPKQGVASSFSFGKGFGIWLGILAALGVPYDLVTPQRWKGVMMAGMQTEKDASRLRAMQLFPSARPDLALKKHHGRADALLLAEYRRRIG